MDEKAKEMFGIIEDSLETIWSLIIGVEKVQGFSHAPPVRQLEFPQIVLGR